LPTGGEYIESSNEGEWSPESRQVVWNIPALVAQNHQNFEVRASLSHPGENTFGVRLSAEDDLAATGEVVTMVEALADLQLVINDPRGPVPVEEETTYEVLISNRGTKAAEMVDVVVFFSEGIEPIAVSGGAAKVETGQVVFHPIEEIAPGEEVVYKITAHANRSGNHVFRTEVACEAADVRLVAEESTRFYGSSSAQADTDEDSQRATPSADDQPDVPVYRREKS
jgi:archaellum component FlaG (FlaF/FlaG flagellin family)